MGSVGLLLALGIAVALAIAAGVAVTLAIAVAIAIAVMAAALAIGTVEYEAGQLGAGGTQGLDAVHDLAPGSIILADHIHQTVGIAGHGRCVGHHQAGGRIDDDIIIAVSQRFDGLLQPFMAQQRRRIAHGGVAGQQMQA